MKQLQDNFEQAGIQVFLDLRDMKGQLDLTMQQNLADCDFVLPILTPKFLESVKDVTTHLAFDYDLTLKKAKTNPGCILPILHSGKLWEVVSGPLSLLSQHLIYTITPEVRIEPLLVGLSDPLGLIPVIYGIRIGDSQYQGLLRRWLNGDLNRSPQLLPDVIKRAGMLRQIHTGFQKQAKHQQAPIQTKQNRLAHVTNILC